MTAPYAHVIQVESSRHRVPAEILAAVMKKESNGQWWKVGAAGELSLMQIKPSTAREMCPFEARLLWWAQPNIACAARILRIHYRRCGTWAAAASHYNGTSECTVTNYGRAILMGLEPLE